jgi:nucleoid-associated protein YgaU
MYKFIITTALTLTLANAGLAQTANDSEMRSLTSNILAGINGDAPVAVEEATGIETDALKGLVQQALSEGQSDAYLEALISEAADRGDIEVPDAMRTTDGELDTKTLLASLVAKSEGVDATDTDALTAEATGEAADAAEDQFYVVQSGDSLAKISLAFYGSAQQYSRIFDANRDTLSSPDRISVGQRLLIPS